MKIPQILLLAGSVLLALSTLAAWAAYSLGGVRGVRFDHVIATFQIQGLSDESHARRLIREFQQQSEVRQADVARSLSSEDLWVARIQFQAPDPQRAAGLIQHWTKSILTPFHTQLIKATYYACRVQRPGRGDVVIGHAEALQPSLLIP